MSLHNGHGAAGSRRAPSLVIVSHYDGWAPDQLIALLDQLRDVPAGAAFDVCVVVNRCAEAVLSLPSRFADVTVLHRPNRGYNIGAWDHGWRTMPPYDDYLFLQEECRILRPGWLAATRRALARPGVGLVGESMAFAGQTWGRLDDEYRGTRFADPVDGRCVPIPTGLRAGLERLGIPVGWSGAHLQALILGIRRDTIERIDGFVVADTYGAATVAECAVSKQVEALGLKVCEIGPGSFRYILHPQWAHRKGPLTAVARRLAAHLPVGFGARLAAIRRHYYARTTTA